MNFGQKISALKKRIVSLSGSERMPLSAGTDVSSPASASGNLNLQQNMENELAASLASILEVEARQIDIDKPFSELGIDSIAAVQWVRYLGGRFSLSIPATTLYDYPTVRRMGTYLLQAKEKMAPETAYEKTPAEQAAIHCSAEQESNQGARSDQRDQDCIAIVGMSGCFPKAPTLADFWNNLVEGRDCVSEISPERWPLEGFYENGVVAPDRSCSKWMGALQGIDRFDCRFFSISPAEAQWMDPQQRLLLEHCWRALEDAGLNPTALSETRCGVFLGCGRVDYGLDAPDQGSTALALMGTSPAILAGRISYFMNLKGPCISINTASSSSLVAIAQACDSLLLKRSDIVLAGGACILSGPTTHIITSDSGMLSSTGHCYSFDERADGFVPAEGVGVTVLMRLEDAIRNRHNIYAIIRGWGINQDGKTNGITAPSAASQTLLQKQVYKDFGIDPSTITLIEAHGTGTRLGDPIEVAALKESFAAFTNRQDYCALASLKSNMGHALAAAGVAGVIKLSLALQQRTIPPTINFERLNEHISLDGSPFFINTVKREWESTPGMPRRAAVNSFGYSGTNAHLVLEEYVPLHSPSETLPPLSQMPVMIVLSAKNNDRLLAQAKQLLQSLPIRAFGDADLPDIAYTLQVGRHAMDARLALIVNSMAELTGKLERIVQGEDHIPGCYRGMKPADRAKIPILAPDADTILQLAEKWAAGAEIDWNRLYKSGLPRRLSLPTYPFAGERYWVEKTPRTEQVKSSVNPQHLNPRPTSTLELPSAENPKVDGYEIMTFQEFWQPQELSVAKARVSGTIVCVLSETAKHATVTEALRELNPQGQTLFLSCGDEYRRVDSTHWCISGSDARSWTAALMELKQQYGELDALLYLDALEIPERSRDYRTIAAMVQAIGTTRASSLLVLAGAYSNPLERSYIDSWIALGRSLRLPEMRVIVVGGERVQETAINDWIARLWAELQGGAIEDVIYENGRRHVRQIREGSREESAPVLRQHGTYLITGGAGKIGTAFASHLAQVYRANLILTGRSAMDPGKQRQTGRLEELGARVWYVQADVCDRDRMREVIASAQVRFGQIHGVIHAAGNSNGESLLTKDLASIESVLRPKVIGTQVLDETLADQSVDFVCYCSSASAVLGDFGSCDYSMANRFQMAYARYGAAAVSCGKKPARVRAIAWPIWKDGNIRPAHEEQYLRATRQRALETTDALALFERLLGEPHSSQLVMCGDPQHIHQWLGISRNLPELSTPPHYSQETPPASGYGPNSLVDKAQRFFKKQVSARIKLPPNQIDVTAPLEQYGIESVMILQLTRDLEKIFGTLPKTLFFQYQTLEAIVQYFLASHHDTLLAAMNEEAPSSPPSISHRETSHAPGLLRSQDSASQSFSAAKGTEIAIIGMAGRYPQARTLEQYWENLRAGKDSITEIPPERWPLDGFYEPDVELAVIKGRSYCKWGGFIDGFTEFDPLFFNISPRDAVIMDPQERLFLQTSWAAMEDAGYTRDTLAGHHRGRVGVFVGVTKAGFELYGPDLWRQGEALLPRTSYGSIANRVSYMLNLQGPSMPIDTMCSASLTAIHEACAHLLRDECELAIAGGVNLYAHPSAYAFLCHRRLLSPDGLCRSFGDGANGMVPGEGVGVVLLKRLTNAIQDEDRIYAVIRGSSINHGGKTNGYTVPNPVAQRDLVRTTLSKAGVHPRTITYIEAHGTGTALGDPIEITGLTQAFDPQTQDRQFCAIGSVKSNIGHLEAAAGIAGLHKIILQMQHGELAPSLHAEQLNLNIDFAETPFIVQRDLAAWKRPQVETQGASDTYPRIAAISSFGAGGSNGHLVVQEYIEEAPSRTSIAASKGAPPQPCLIVLSARAPESLREQVRQLLDALDRGSYMQDDLPNIAYTLQVGREAFAHRLALVVSTISQLRQKLQSTEQGEETLEDVYRGEAPQDQNAVALLTADEDTSALVERWLAKAKYSNLLELWVKGFKFDWNQLYPNARPKRIALPTYPFAREQYWLPLAKDFSAFPVTTVNSVQGAPLHPLAQVNTSDLAEQRFTSTFTGNEFFLADHVVRGKRVLPGSAYLEMARAAVELARPVESGIPSSQPFMPFCLKEMVWLQPLTVEDAPVAVHIGLELRDNDEIAYEIYTNARSTAEKETGEAVIHGQGTAMLHIAPESPRLDLARLRQQCKQVLTQQQCYSVYEELGLSYGAAHRSVEQLSAGQNELGSRFVLGELRLPASLAESRTQYGLHPSLLDGALQALLGLREDGVKAEESRRAPMPFALDRLDFLHPAPNGATWVYIHAAEDSTTHVPKLDLDLCDENGAVWARLRGLTIRTLEHEVTQPQSRMLMMSPAWEADAIPAQTASTPTPAYLQHYVILSAPKGEVPESLSAAMPDVDWMPLPEIDAKIEIRFEHYAFSVLLYLQQILRSRPKDVTLVQLVVPTHDESGMLMGLSGLLKVAQLENPRLVTQLIGIEGNESLAELAQRLRENARRQDAIIRYANGARFVERLQEMDALAASANLFKPEGVYLLTGGAGELGVQVALEMARRAPDLQLVLAGRSRMDELQSRALEALQRLGARAEYHCVNVADRLAVEELIAGIVARCGRLNGIIHCAGLTRDSFLLNKTPEELAEVLSPKVRGLVHLDEATREVPLEFFVTFSSLAGVLGNVGQGDYAAANAFMDRYICHRTKLVQAGMRSGISVSLDWPLWAEGGMKVDAATRQRMKERGFQPLSVEEGMEALHRGLASGFAQVVIATGNPAKIRLALRPEAPHLPAKTAEPASAPSPLTHNKLAEQTIHFLKKHLAPVLDLRMEKIAADVGMAQYGLDSVIALRLTAELEKSFGPLAKTLFFEYRTIEALAGYFLESHRDELMKILHPQEPQAPASIQKTQAISTPLPRQRRGRTEKVQAAPKSGQPLDVAIIGVAGRYPQARTLQQFWEILKLGKDCITEIPTDRWDHSRYFDPEKGKPGKSYSKWGGFVDGVDEFDPLFFNVTPRDAELMNPQERLFLQCAYETIEDAGYTRETLGRYRGLGLEGNVGVFVGIMYDEYPFFGIEAQATGRPFALLGNPASIANRISYILNLHGPSMVVNTMCSSSLTALHLACQTLIHGGCEMAIAGGVNLSIHPNKYLSLSRGQFASSTGRCKSFGEGGDGYVPSEGVGAVLLKPLAQAIADGDHIYAVVKGTALNHGGKTNGYNIPNPTAQAHVIAQALKSSGVSARSISYIEAHGTGTSLGDPIEISGLSKVFQEETPEKQFCAIGSVKSNIGHAESAAGIAGITKVLLQMKHCQLAPSLHAETLNPYMDFSNSPFIVQRELASWTRPHITVNGKNQEYPRLAGVSSFGAGGANAHVVLQEYVAPEVRPSVNFPTPFMVVLSAKSEPQLQMQAQNLLQAIETEGFTDDDLPSIAYTLQTGREAMDHRLALLTNSIEQLRNRLERLLAGEDGIEDLYRGEVKGFKQVLGTLAGDDDADVLLQTWIKKKKYGRLLDLWVKGLKLDWNILYDEQHHPPRISLPTYPFARERYWIPHSDQAVIAGAPASGTAAKARSELLLSKTWRYSPVSSGRASARHVAILATTETHALALRVADHIKESTILYIDAPDFAQYAECIPWSVCDGWIDLTGCGESRHDGTEFIPYLQQWIEKSPKAEMPTALCVTSRLEAYENPGINLAGAFHAGLYRVIQSEYRRLRSRHMDTDLTTHDNALPSQIVAEFFAASDAVEVCYRRGERYCAQLQEMNGPALRSGVRPISAFPADHVLWITGGTRGLGQECARHFVRHHGVKHLLLTGREPFPPRSEWAKYQEQQDALGAKVRAVLELEAEGAKVRISSVPLADLQALRQELEEVAATLGPIGGVIHCAGRIDLETAPLIRKNRKTMESVMVPKIQGLDNLLACVEREPLQFVVLFSSVSAAVPSLAAGQIDYAAANAYMDYVAQAFAAQLPIISIQWPSWSESGFGEAKSQAYQQTGLLTLKTSEGLRLLDRVLTQRAAPVVLPAIVDTGRWHPEKLMLSTIEDGHARTQTPPVAKVKAATGGAAPSLKQAAESWLRSMIAAQLKMDHEQLESNRSLLDYGVDSVMLVQLARPVGEALGEKLPPSILFECPTIGEFSSWLVTNHSGSLGKVVLQSEDEDAAILNAADQQAATVGIDEQHPAAVLLHEEPETKSLLQTRPAVEQSYSSEIAVIGMSCQFPGASNLQEYWRLLTEGRSALRKIPPHRYAQANGSVAGMLDNTTFFDPRFFLISDADARAMDPQALLVLEESLNALHHAGYSRHEMKGTSIGVYIGGRSYHRPDPVSLSRALNPILAVGQNYLAANIARFLDLHGPALVVDTACSSALVAMHLAIQALSSGEVGAALVGGVSLLREDALRLFDQRGILSKSPQFHLFDSRASGTILGEGAGMVVLKPLKQAECDGDSIYAVIKAVAINNDGRTASASSPNLKAQQEVMQAALQKAAVRPEDISYVCMNGSGSEVTDLLELKAVQSVYRASAPLPCCLGSMKPNIGHPLCAEGIASFISVALMLHHGELVPFLSGEQPMAHYDWKGSPFRFNRASELWNSPRRLAAINCFADGGTNAHVILQASESSLSRPALRRPLPPPPLEKVDVRMLDDNLRTEAPPLNGDHPKTANFWNWISPVA